MEKADKFRTDKEAEEYFGSLYENLRKASIEAQEYYAVELERFRNSDRTDNERLDFIEDIFDIAESLAFLSSRAGRVFKRGKDKGFFK